MADSEYVRILQCVKCKTFEVVPDFDTTPDASDERAQVPNVQLLDRFVAPHDDLGHPEALRLLRIEKYRWDSTSERQQIIDRIQEEFGDGLGKAFYDVKDQFTHDAHVCFQKHNRNPDCSDYGTDKYRLQPDTRAERQAAGLGRFQSNVYLCQFCPVHARVRAARFTKRGLRD